LLLFCAQYVPLTLTMLNTRFIERNSTLSSKAFDILINTIVLTSNLESTETEFYRPNLILRHVLNLYESKDGVHLTADVLTLFACALMWFAFSCLQTSTFSRPMYFAELAVDR
jgi:hypothetical protein